MPIAPGTSATPQRVCRSALQRAIFSNLAAFDRA